MGSNSSGSSFSNRLSLLFKARSSNRTHERHGSTDSTILKYGIIKDLASQSKRVPADLHLLMQLIDMKSAGGYEDDSLYVVRFAHYKITDSTARASYPTCCVSPAKQYSEVAHQFVYFDTLEQPASPATFIPWGQFAIPHCRWQQQCTYSLLFH